jgi:hypothetical protein
MLFQGAYNNWCKANTFTSKLPRAVKKAKEDAKRKQVRLTEGQLDEHLCDIPKTERTIPYSDKLFRETAVRWLIATDQVCDSESLAYINQ